MILRQSEIVGIAFFSKNHKFARLFDLRLFAAELVGRGFAEPETDPIRLDAVHGLGTVVIV